jgi:hypothetical protein
MAMPQPIKTVKVWLNAFIPSNVSGVTIPVPSGGDRTMLAGPPTTGCFLTDNRTYSENIHASSRMHSELTVDVAGPTKGLEWHNCDPTHQLHCASGAPRAVGHGRTNRMRFMNLRGSASSTIKFDLRAAANNPLVSGSPDIDYEGVFTIDVPRRRLSFDGKVDAFPAFEMYASINNTKALTLLRLSPEPGKSPLNLPGWANRPVSVSVGI